MQDFEVIVLVRTWDNHLPKLGAVRQPDGRWSFTERVRTTSAQEAVALLTHYATTRPVPLTLEIRCQDAVFKATPGKDALGAAIWGQLVDGTEN